MERFDLAVVGGSVVVPYTGVVRCDVGIRNGRVVALAERIPAEAAAEVVDARGKWVFPGAVDSHFHLGIYRGLAEDASSETRSALAGGVTSILSYFRTGHHYLNRSGPYREIFPEVLSAVEGNAYTDYGFHIAIMTELQLDEVGWLVDSGVTSFKYYMFYKGLNLTADSTRASEYTMADNYDLGHLFLLMERVSEQVRRRTEGRISLSLHCEHAELLRVFIERVRRAGLSGLEAYHRARPPLSERLSLAEAVVLADATRCPINLLHLSSREVMEAAVKAKREYPHLDIRLEVTVHHLALTYATAGGVRGKVNPPIRTEEDREALWEAVLSGDVDTVVSDHACCFEEEKGEDLWRALPGFGGTALLYPYLISEGMLRRGLSPARVAELASANSARAFGLYPRKGTLTPGADADLAVVDLEREQEVHPELLLSAQDFTPFEGMRLRGWPVYTIRGGQVVFANGQIRGGPTGRYLRRPLRLEEQGR
ncbi:MAG: amidohydrolase family protein [Armatimonadota bacterium]|nr:amidohydrolase family protein [Armatimonadota bacterium]MDW8157010.1 amidohydrolase family protein [Armatimonadota bacterium]